MICPSEIGRGNSVCLCSWNCHLTTGYFDLLQLIKESSFKFAVVGICEIFLNSDQSLSPYFFPGYGFEVTSQISMNHGGLGFLIKENLKYLIRYDLRV